MMRYKIYMNGPLSVTLTKLSSRAFVVRAYNHNTGERIENVYRTESRAIHEFNHLTKYNDNRRVEVNADHSITVGQARASWPH